MSRIMLIGLSVALLPASSIVQPHLEIGRAFSNAAYAEQNPSTGRVKKIDHFTKRGSGKKGGGPAGLAVSDPGAEGTKPVKGKKK